MKGRKNVSNNNESYHLKEKSYFLSFKFHIVYDHRHGHQDNALQPAGLHMNGDWGGGGGGWWNKVTFVNESLPHYCILFSSVLMTIFKRFMVLP